LVEQKTNEMRDAALTLDAFFIIGLLLLFVLHFTERKMPAQVEVATT
jgi:hypothetical protein